MSFLLALVIAAATPPAQDVVAACRDDAAKVCPKVKPGRGRMLRCLRKHKAELSPGCAAALGK